jgi:hypothetical protein
MLESVEKINTQLNYEKMTHINKYKLHEECASLPNDVFIVSDLAAEQQKKVSDILDEINYDKELLKNARAGIELKYRKGILKINDITGKPLKLTENLVKALVENNDEIIERNRLIFDKQKIENEERLKLDKLQGVLKSLQCKKEELSNIMDQVRLGITSIGVDDQREKINKINQERGKNK